MRNFHSSLIGTLTALLIAPAVLAADNYVTHVTPQPGTVTLSSVAQPTFAAYEITITNNKPNPISGVRLIGTANVVGGVEKATFKSSTGIACQTATTDLNSVSCPLGQVAGGGTSVTFSVTFNAPGDGTQINFVWSSVFDESGGGASDGAAGTTMTVLSPPDPSKVTSRVPQGGTSFTFFTGTTGVATVADPWTTTVVVPPVTNATTAEVVESAPQSACSSDLRDCRVSTLNIPGTFASLEITLRRDVSTIRKGAKIVNSLLYYAADGVNFDPNPLPLCADVGGGPSLLNPRCISSRTAYTKRTAPTPAFEGDWEWVILAITNGGYRN